MTVTLSDGSMGALQETIPYAYGDANWKDLLTSYSGKPITYDAIGNLKTYDGWTYTWQAGRQLQKMEKETKKAEFTYDANGLRAQKKVTEGSTVTTTDYTLHGKLVTHLKQGSDNLHFFYDAQNWPAMVNFNGTLYTYVHNLQGDIVAIVDSTGTMVVEYKYDAWGKPLSGFPAGTLKDTLGKLSPFRYRGYVWDQETELYYLRSRYYSPEWGRFINEDTLLGNAGELLSHNLFAYCSNNPVVRSDASGMMSVSDYAKAGSAAGPLGMVIGALVGISIIAIANTVSNARSISATYPQDRPVAQPTTMVFTGTQTLSNTDNPIMGSEYYKAYIDKNDQFLYKSGEPMGFREAYLWSTAMALNNLFFKNYKKGQWGLYTPTQEAAEYMAVFTWGNLGTPNPQVHGINYYGHYHDPNHIYHIWFGMPIH